MAARSSVAFAAAASASASASASMSRSSAHVARRAVAGSFAAPQGQVVMRSFSSSARAPGLMDGLASRMRAIRDGASRLAGGNRLERERASRQRGPAEPEPRALAPTESFDMGVDSEGNPLADVSADPTDLRLEAQEAARRRKAALRVQRKRWSVPRMVVPPGGGDAVAVYDEHKYSTATFRISPRKLKMLADQIGGKPIDSAILQMQFSGKKASKRIKSTLALARAHAVQKGMRPHHLVVAEAWVGKGRTYRSLEVKGRGKLGIRKSPTARLSIVLREGKTQDVKERKALELARRRVRSIGTGGVVRVARPVINAWKRPGWNW